jgi:anoctamin-10
LDRWGINYSISEYKNLGNDLDLLSDSRRDSLTVEGKKFHDVSAEKRKLQRNEWFGVLLKIRNNSMIVLAIICLQLPFELAYAHLYEITEHEVLR